MTNMCVEILIHTIHTHVQSRQQPFKYDKVCPGSWSQNERFGKTPREQHTKKARHIVHGACRDEGVSLERPLDENVMLTLQSQSFES